MRVVRCRRIRWVKFEDGGFSSDASLVVLDGWVGVGEGAWSRFGLEACAAVAGRA